MAFCVHLVLIFSFYHFPEHMFFLHMYRHNQLVPLFLAIFYLSFFGYETDRFNNIIKSEVKKSNNNIKDIYFSTKEEKLHNYLKINIIESIKT